MLKWTVDDNPETNNKYLEISWFAHYQFNLSFDCILHTSVDSIYFISTYLISDEYLDIISCLDIDSLDVNSTNSINM